ncbi:MAG TPA: methyltransferase domain-containing protein [Gemmatimonadaceae bacterium]|nr:methyltransferase domain-containing protein [Gemmatimonadaceae bacterium]
MFLPAPRRRRGIEYLDAPDVDPALVTRSLRDVAIANRLFGGARAVLAELRPVFDALRARGRREATLLDVGTGIGDIPERARAAAAASGIALTTIGLDAAAELAEASRSRMTHSVCGSALALPLRDDAVDIVTCSQVLHHFTEPDARVLLGELHRVARVRVVVSDLRRSWAAAAGIWAASFPLGFHPVSRHDGVVSVMRGFTASELRAWVRETVGREPAVTRRPIARITASWEPRPGEPNVRSGAGAPQQ